MLLPKGGVTWKSAKSRLPPYKKVLHFITRPRLLLLVALVAIITLSWKSLSGTAEEVQRYGYLLNNQRLYISSQADANPFSDAVRFYCWGPAKAPVDMTPNEQAHWNAHLQTPVIFNHHAPIEVNSTTVKRVDLNSITSTRDSIRNEERVLIVTPLKDAAPYLEQHFDLISQLTYPHHLIDLAFLVGDSTDDTLALLAKELERVQKRQDKTSFHSTMIVEKNFGGHLSQSVEDRHGFAAQGPRRKTMGKARNYLLSAAMKPEHAWVYWRDVDIKDSPNTIIEDFTLHDRDILVPSACFRSFGFTTAKLTSCLQTFGSTDMKLGTERSKILRGDVCASANFLPCPSLERR